MMPGLSGRDVCLKIRETSTIPILLVTALDSNSDQMLGFKLGADDYIPKPFHPSLLAARVAANLRRAYRYDLCTPEKSAASEPRDAVALANKVPVGWATCESCGYIGPRLKFEREDASGRTSLLCPNCKQSDFITFTLA